jgi:hypothetical protein
VNGRFFVPKLSYKAGEDNPVLLLSPSSLGVFMMMEVALIAVEGARPVSCKNDFLARRHPRFRAEICGRDVEAGDGPVPPALLLATLHWLP